MTGTGVRIVVAGALASKPSYGGEAWVRLTWALGLRALGAHVLFLEHIDQDARPHPAGAHEGVAFFRRVCRAFGLEGSAALIGRGDRVLAGAPLTEVLDFATGADLLVNLSGHLRYPAVFDAVRRRAYVDLDPGYTQFWHAAGVDGLRLAEHDVHFTVGLNVGREGCGVPTGGFSWIPTLPPVLLAEWPAAPPARAPRFTTVASWRGAYGPVVHGGRSYGLKVHQFRAVADLPRRAPYPFEIALDMHPADARDRRLMERHGWTLVDPRRTAATPEAFREYVRGSGAEFSVAQGIYVETASGWFSDRSAHYLAAGRPVVVQDTGIGRTLPLGEGVLSFRTVDEAAAAARAVAEDPRRHEGAARQIAEHHLDARIVLARFLDRALPASRPSARPTRRRTVVVSGMVARVPGQGGATWAALQYVLGLRAAGHDVLLVEELEPEDLLPDGVTLAASRNAAYFRRVVQRFGLAGKASLLLRGTRSTVGLPREELKRRLGPDAVLLNLSGTLRDEELRDRIPTRVYVDLDPAFTQFWHVDGEDVGMEGHTHHATVGLELGRPGCEVPSCDRTWIRTLPPVALDWWAPDGAPRRDALTTVANWRGYGSVHRNGTVYGQKAHAFRELFGLPARLEGERFEVALAIHPDEKRDLDDLRRHGWHVLDPERVAGDPDSYHAFVRGSAAELGVAKAGYVRSRCGWFSDRSACYLAAGRPVLAQETGFGAHLPTGEGLLAFGSLEEAEEGVRALRADYARHARAARRIAEDLFDARKVLCKLLEEVGT